MRNGDLINLPAIFLNLSSSLGPVRIGAWRDFLAPKGELLTLLRTGPALNRMTPQNWKDKYGHSRAEIERGTYATLLQGIILAAEHASRLARQKKYPAGKKMAAIVWAAEEMLDSFRQEFPVEEGAAYAGREEDAGLSDFVFALLFASARECSNAESLAEIQAVKDAVREVEEVRSDIAG